jgi:hypothetical protein
MPNQKICEANKALGLEVREFMIHVPDVKEESITDYLVWKWKLLDARFSYVNIKTFSRQEEHSTTGADFELELWFVGKTFAVPLLFQAKKFNKEFDAYMGKLNYPNNTHAQLSTLLAYAAANNRLPFYAIYTAAAAKATTKCKGGGPSDTGVYMVNAKKIQEFANGVHGKRISLSALLAEGNPFHCLLCCPFELTNYFAGYFGKMPGEARYPLDRLPYYVRNLLNSQVDDISSAHVAEVTHVNVVGVYDMREE